MLKSKNKTSKPKAEEEYFSNRADQSDSDNNQAKDSSGDEKNDENSEETKKPIKIKTVVRKPQPKLDPTRLCGTRGLDCLLEIFDKFKSKGSNHEYQDLDKMISQYEYWSHRLFPKMKFNDVIERLEKLGEKREVKNKMNTLRMGLENKQDDQIDPALEDQAITERVMNMMNNINTSDEEEDQQQEEISRPKTNTATTRPVEEEVDEDELFNRLLNENSEIRNL